MRRSFVSLTAVGAVLALVVLLGLGRGAAPASASCVGGIVRGGHFYAPLTTLDWDVGRLGKAIRRVAVIEPACNDAGQDAPDLHRKMYRYAAAPASVMVSPDPRLPRDVYFRFDSFPVLAAHPLHAAIYGAATAPDLRRGPCRALTPRTGRVSHIWSLDSFALRPRGWHGITYRMDAATRFETREVDGVPRLRPGDRVRVHALRCYGRRLAVVVRGR